MAVGIGAKPTPCTQVHDLVTWLVDRGLKGASQEDILQGYCDQMVALGVPLWRFFLGQRAFHPKFGNIGFNWMADEGVTSQVFEYRETPSEDWLQSPLFAMVEQGLSEIRFDLRSQTDYQEFPLLVSLKERGVTDYVAAGLKFTDEDFSIESNAGSEGVLLSWSTNDPKGFDPNHLDAIRASLPHLGLALKSSANRRMASDLLKVYLGRDAGRRVLSGEIQRGSSREINAVICLFDLRGFTSLAEQIPGAELIEMLNDYFGLAVAAIQSKGGNILKFMGDGILAIFDLGDLEADAVAALEAAKDLDRAVRTRNLEREAQGLTVTDFTLALHAGPLLYGNIGAENRLDFTVIGPSVNLAARISDMHVSVGRNIIVSENVQQVAGEASHDLVSLGRYMLRGVSEPIELFTIYSPS
ncbi:adenylate/guanylate cyclase domain-containing protein [Epibacterium sp. SM1979]|uniref:Adenylate/guanylate cyclase domain-containing protein n=1 Tax=Tritonibacter litoralis TaxID=2662264 RepID=A0A843YC87_9RHOB|nr:adenylate/guanylate cyclase domain-containing protein [Tritonibacter litoralis]MQQ08616.1 adenylate/guanylate cyclase domain-containing protein [Tritonibacter litoralis]